MRSEGKGGGRRRIVASAPVVTGVTLARARSSATCAALALGVALADAYRCRQVNKRLFVTGKMWTKLFEIEIVEGGADREEGALSAGLKRWRREEERGDWTTILRAKSDFGGW